MSSFFAAFSAAFAFLLLLATTVVWLIGARNPYTPAGYVGYLTKGAVFGKARFYGIQRGPTSAGRSWLLEVTNVSITPYTYNEDFTRDDAVLSRDNLKIAFRVHTVWRVDDTGFLCSWSASARPRQAAIRKRNPTPS